MGLVRSMVPTGPTERGRHLDAFFGNIDWAVVERRLREPAAVRPARA